MKTEKFLLFYGPKATYFPKVGHYIENNYELLSLEGVPILESVTPDVLKIIDDLKLLSAPLLISVDIVAIEKVLIEKKFFDRYMEIMKHLPFYDKEYKMEKKQLVAYVHVLLDKIGVSFKDVKIPCEQGRRYVIKEFILKNIPEAKDKMIIFNQD